MAANQEDLKRIEDRLNGDDEYNHLNVGEKQVIILGSGWWLADMEMTNGNLIIRVRPKRGDG